MARLVKDKVHHGSAFIILKSKLGTHLVIDVDCLNLDYSFRQIGFYMLLPVTTLKIILFNHSGLLVLFIISCNHPYWQIMRNYH